MPQQVHHHTFPNGLTLLLERMDHVRSAAVNFLVPAGCVYDPPDQLGLVSIFSDMITRGAGDRDSRALTLAMDSLGLDHSESVGQLHLRFWGSTLARNIPPALELFADILRRPHLPADELDAVKALALQDLQALEDEPRAKVMVEMRRRFWPAPLGQDRRGTKESIAKITPESIRAFHFAHLSPRRTILSVAGNIEWQPLLDQVEKLFGDWTGDDRPPPELAATVKGQAHLEKDTTQTQIVIGYPSVPFGHPDYYAALGAAQVLSGGMGARLFTEVREKRGLCYAVSANYQTFKQVAGILCFAGTTTERAQETLDVTIGELKRMIEGVTEEEVQRVRAGLKSSVIMQEESTSARAGALASDWYYLGRVRSTEEIQAAIDALAPESILDHVKRYPPEDLTIVTLGKHPLVLPQTGESASSKTTEIAPIDTEMEVAEPTVTEPTVTEPTVTEPAKTIKAKPIKAKAAKATPVTVKPIRTKLVKIKPPNAKPAKVKVKASRVTTSKLRANKVKPKKVLAKKVKANKAKANKVMPGKVKPAKATKAKPRKVKASSLKSRKVKTSKSRPAKTKAKGKIRR